MWPCRCGRWALAKRLDLEDDDDADGAEAAEHKAIGYNEERIARQGGGRGKNGPFVSQFPAPRMCYTPEGLVVRAQTSAAAQPEGSPSRVKGAGSELAEKARSPTRVIGGQRHRVMLPGSKFLRQDMHKIPPHGKVAGLPFAFGQILLEASLEFASPPKADAPKKALPSPAAKQIGAAGGEEAPKQVEAAPEAAEGAQAAP